MFGMCPTTTDTDRRAGSTTMAKRSKADPLIQTVERALDPSRSVSYGASWESVQ